MDEKQMSQQRLISQAIGVFQQGFSFTRSLTHPYLVECVESLTVLRDATRKRNDYRTEEWCSYDVSPQEVDRIVKANARGRYAICAFCGVDESQESLRSEFKALDYRLMRTEPLMLHHLENLPECDSPAIIERVITPELAEKLAVAQHSKPLRPKYFESDSPLRQYVALLDGEVVGRVGSIRAGDATWCSAMVVDPAFRRRGIAKSLLSRMLHDDKAAGSQLAVLLASHAGAKLYPVVGYEQIATLLLFTPRKR